VRMLLTMVDMPPANTLPPLVLFALPDMLEEALDTWEWKKIPKQRVQGGAALFNFRLERRPPLLPQKRPLN
jgi:hypothetical protein